MSCSKDEVAGCLSPDAEEAANQTTSKSLIQVCWQKRNSGQLCILTEPGFWQTSNMNQVLVLPAHTYPSTIRFTTNPTRRVVVPHGITMIRSTRPKAGRAARQAVEMPRDPASVWNAVPRQPPLHRLQQPPSSSPTSLSRATSSLPDIVRVPNLADLRDLQPPPRRLALLRPTTKTRSQFSK